MKRRTAAKKVKREKKTEADHLRAVIYKALDRFVENDEILRAMAAELGKLNSKIDAIMLIMSRTVGSSH
jgi:hypothetical protein